MNTFSALAPATLAVAVAAAATLLAAAPAQAQEATPDHPQAVASQTTRAQVQAELAQARRDGSMNVWSTRHDHLAAASSLKTRAEVRAELLAGAGVAYSGEDSGSFALARLPVAAPVLATLAGAR